MGAAAKPAVPLVSGDGLTPLKRLEQAALMKIAYINGPYRDASYSRSSRSPAVTKSGTLYYPLWLSYAAGYAQSKGAEAFVVDAVAWGWNYEAVGVYAAGARTDLAVIDTSTPSIAEDLRTAAAIKKHAPQTRVVLAGTHATARSEELLRSCAAVDYIARGEYDQTIVDLAAALRAGDEVGTVKGLSFRRGAEIAVNADRSLIEDLDSFPYVSRIYREQLRIKDYFFAAARYPMVMIVTSRGCPHRCQWCLYPQVMHRGKYRMRSAGNVAAEFAYIAAALPEVREVGIEDDLFTGDKRRLREICDLLIEQKNRLPFWCDTRVDLGEEDMRRLKAAGCRLLIAGFESGSQAVLDRIEKRTTTEEGMAFMGRARRAGLLVHGCFVLGNPGETSATMRETVEYAKRLDPDTAQFFPMMVYPGTAMYNWARQQGYLRTEAYTEWLTADGLHTSVVDQPGLPGAAVQQMCDQARREFYLRQRYIFKKVKQSLRSKQEAKRNVKAFWRLARHLSASTEGR